MSKISVRGKKLLIKFHGGPPSRIAGVAEIGPHNHRRNISELAHHEFYDSPRIELRAVVVQNTKIAPEQTCQIAIANRLGIPFPLTLPLLCLKILRKKGSEIGLQTIRGFPSRSENCRSNAWQRKALPQSKRCKGRCFPFKQLLR